jgi:hypothetical protein
VALSDLRVATVDVLAALDPDQRVSAARPFDDPARFHFEFRPGDRPGIALAALDQARRDLVHRLLRVAVSPLAYAQVAAIIALEDVLDALEGGARHRSSGDYWLAVFGDPGPGAWALRFEGHHVSLNLTLSGDEVVDRPLFLGAHPARSAIVPLRDEEHLARALVAAVPEAVIAPDAPAEILTDVDPVVSRLEPAGVVGADMTGDALASLDALVRLYVDRSPALARRPVDPGVVAFAWAGSTVVGQGHYYRLQGPRFLVEYDNSRDGANHVHTVVRDPQGDFGRDLLAHHLKEHHA